MFGPLAERLPREWTTALIFVLQVAGLLVLLRLGRRGGRAGSSSLLFGMGGAVTPARAALLADFYGPAEYGAISGVMAFLLTLARAIAPLGASLLHDAAGGYDPVFCDTRRLLRARRRRRRNRGPEGDARMTWAWSDCARRTFRFVDTPYPAQHNRAVLRLGAYRGESHAPERLTHSRWIRPQSSAGYPEDQLRSWDTTGLF